MSSGLANAAAVLLIVVISGCGGGPTPLNNPPLYVYSSSYYAFTVGVPAQNITPANHGGGQAASWSITPALPAGLTFDITDGTISGKPTGAAAAANYTVIAATALDQGGQSSITLSIAVAAAPLLDLGQTSELQLLRFANSSVLSESNAYAESGNIESSSASSWLLQDYASGTVLARGENGPGVGVPGSYVDLKGNIMVDQIANGLEVRSASSGQVLVTIATPANVSWYRLATDASYIAAGSPTALTLWSISGQMLQSLSGNYAGANPYAAPSQIFIAQGPAGTNVIQTVAVATGASAVSPAYTGTFNTWAVDGQHFLTNTGNVVWTYSSAAIAQDRTSVTTVAGLAGFGGWFWTFDGSGTLDIYQVGASMSPTVSTVFGTGALAIPSGGTIGVLGPGAGRVTIIDLSGAAPTSVSYTVPYSPDTYAASSAAQWIAGDYYGVIVDGASLGGTPRTLTLGAATSIAGGSNYFSVATASGRIFNYDTAGGSVVGTISFPASFASSSSDGTVLAVASRSPSQPGETQTLNIYSLPSGTLLASTTFPELGSLTAIALSGSGTVINESFAASTTNSCVNQVVPITGGAPIYCGPAGSVQVSPDGSLVAAEQAALTAAPTTNIYKNGALISAAPGSPVFWVDNSDVLLNQYSSGGSPNPPMAIYNSLGTLVATAAAYNSFDCQIRACQIVSTGLLYDAGGAIQSYLSGATTWESGDYNPSDVGVLAGSQIIFPSSVYVLAQPY